MKNNKFAVMLGTYLSDYLPKEQGVSPNTISSYCDTFRLFLKFVDSDKGISVDKISFKDIKKETVLSFLQYLKKERNCSSSTINQRFAGIRSFATIRLRYIRCSEY
jgi:site-specific recombinase XerD